MGFTGVTAVLELVAMWPWSVCVQCLVHHVGTVGGFLLFSRVRGEEAVPSGALCGCRRVDHYDVDSYWQSVWVMDGMGMTIHSWGAIWGGHGYG